MTNVIAAYEEKDAPSATLGVVATPNERPELPFFNDALYSFPPFVQFQIKIRVGNDVHPHELEAAVARLNEISALGANWDSYGGLPISSAVIEKALRLLINTYLTTGFVPELFPTSRGGIELHWALDCRELEVEIRPDLQFEALFVNDATGEELEPPQPVALDEVRSLIRRVLNNT